MMWSGDYLDAEVDDVDFSIFWGFQVSARWDLPVFAWNQFSTTTV